MIDCILGALIDIADALHQDVAADRVQVFAIDNGVVCQAVLRTNGDLGRQADAGAGDQRYDCAPPSAHGTRARHKECRVLADIRSKIDRPDVAAPQFRRPRHRASRLGACCGWRPERWRSYDPGRPDSAVLAESAVILRVDRGVLGRADSRIEHARE